MSGVVPYFQNTEVKVAPAKQRRAADQECVGPDKQEGEQCRPVAGEGELPVVGHHHVPLHRQDREGDN